MKLSNRNTSMNENLKWLKQRIADLEAENKRLRERVDWWRKTFWNFANGYGYHNPKCPQQPCSCGYENAKQAALKEERDGSNANRL